MITRSPAYESTRKNRSNWQEFAKKLARNLSFPVRLGEIQKVQEILHPLILKFINMPHYP